VRCCKRELRGPLAEDAYLPRIASAALTMLMVGFLAQYSPNFLALSTNTSVSMIASSSSPLYQPSIQVSTILISSSPPSTNCLQVRVERSSTTACAGTDDNANAAANRIETVVFMMISIISLGVRSLGCDLFSG